MHTFATQLFILSHRVMCTLALMSATFSLSLPLYQWVQDGSPAHANNGIKIENPHQFVPIALDASEFRKKQKEVCIHRMTLEPLSHCDSELSACQLFIVHCFFSSDIHCSLQMKSVRLQNKISSGPQSTVSNAPVCMRKRKQLRDHLVFTQII